MRSIVLSGVLLHPAACGLARFLLQPKVLPILPFSELFGSAASKPLSPAQRRGRRSLMITKYALLDFLRGIYIPLMDIRGITVQDRPQDRTTSALLDKWKSDVVVVLCIIKE